MIANIFMGFGLGVIFYYILKDPLPPVSSRAAAATWKQLPLYFGTAIYAFEGIGMVSLKLLHNTCYRIFYCGLF